MKLEDGGHAPEDGSPAIDSLARFLNACKPINDARISEIVCTNTTSRALICLPPFKSARMSSPDLSLNTTSTPLSANPSIRHPGFYTLTAKPHRKLLLCAWIASMCLQSNPFALSWSSCGTVWCAVTHPLRDPVEHHYAPPVCCVIEFGASAKRPNLPQ